MGRVISIMFIVACMFCCIFPAPICAQGLTQKLYQTWKFDAEKTKEFLRKEGATDKRIADVEPISISLDIRETEMFVDSNFFDQRKRIRATMKILKFDEEQKTIEIEIQPEIDEADGLQKSTLTVQFLTDDLIVIRPERGQTMVLSAFHKEDEPKENSKTKTK